MERVNCYVGIHVSKATLDVVLSPSNEGWQAPNTEEGVIKLVGQMREMQPDLVVLEATGGCEVLLVGAIAEAKTPVVMFNPRQTMDFARAMGTLAKTVNH